ncbi:hypothetical protein PAMC26577_34795 [Caballeronia sordidicola]|uniref:Uncharacterized protein n=1 Tax=Caballeronia sordidicola TaxID=196367 RepID=A0A242MAA5_CABSO|nr:hypothetical protein PAMC26577_34795 [Caballeronia sordidicola]
MESAVSQIIDERLSKSQQMHRSHKATPAPVSRTSALHGSLR